MDYSVTGLLPQYREISILSIAVRHECRRKDFSAIKQIPGNVKTAVKSDNKIKYTYCVFVIEEDIKAAAQLSANDSAVIESRPCTVRCHHYVTIIRAKLNMLSPLIDQVNRTVSSLRVFYLSCCYCVALSVRAHTVAIFVQMS